MHEVKAHSVDRLECFEIALSKVFSEMPFHLWISGVLILMLKVKMDKFRLLVGLNSCTEINYI